RCVGLEVRSVPLPWLRWDERVHGWDVEDRAPYGGGAFERPDDLEGLPRWHGRVVPLTTTDLHKLRFGEIMAEDREDAIVQHLVSASMLEDQRENLLALAREWQGSEGRGRPQHYGPDHYADVAAVYLEAVETGRPTATVAEHFT